MAYRSDRLSRSSTTQQPEGGEMVGVVIRDARPEDADPLSRLLNSIVDEGDKTAIEQHLSPEAFTEWFIAGEHCLGCVVATESEQFLGFQAVEGYHDDLPPAWVDVATFVSEPARGKGIGMLLMDTTLRNCLERHLQVLRAVVRRSNEGAVDYYRRLGFSELPPADHSPPSPSIVMVRHTTPARTSAALTDR